MAIKIQSVEDEIHLSRSTDISLVLKSLRVQKGATQQEMADVLGISQKTFSALERNAYNANFSRLFKLLDLLDAEIIIKRKV